jgi:hypothetical protein
LDLINRRGTPDLILAAGCVMDGAGVLPARWRRWASSRGGAIGGAYRRSLSHATVQGASRNSSQRGQAKRVQRKLQITDVGLLELEKLLTRRGDEEGYLGLASVFLKILARGVIYL